MSTAGPSQGANGAPGGGSAAAELANEAASVGVHFRPTLVAAALIAGASVAPAQPRFESASPTAGGTTSQQANTTADKTVYQAVEYSNKNIKGPALVVIPGEIKSSNATFL